MITAPEIWDIICTKMSRNRWILLKEIYQLVERNAHRGLDDVNKRS